MSKLDDLQKIVADMFEKAESKEAIDNLSKIKNGVDDAIKEHKALESENKQLIKDYKEAMTGFVGDKSKASIENNGVGAQLDFDSELANFLEENNKKK